jgi:putative transposase
MAALAPWLKEYFCRLDVAFHPWVFMTNHMHLLMAPQTSTGVSAMMQLPGRS